MIKYRDGYKYQLAADYYCKVNILPRDEIVTEFINLDRKGNLRVKAGYAWDGPSGPTIDTPNFMRGSLVHDALYQLMRHGYLSYAERGHADIELQKICLEDGMTRIRAWWVYQGVKLGGGPSARPSGQKRVHYAP